jgi:hypothetical protein
VVRDAVVLWLGSPGALAAMLHLAPTGRGIYRPHGAIRYATLAQLALEERLTTQAQQTDAPHLDDTAVSDSRSGRGDR